MKILVIIAFISLFGWLTNSTMSSIKNTSHQTDLESTDSIHFNLQIQPILAKNCSPCHFPGGKMYQRMPFDQDTTIVNHESGVLKRIKGDENAILKAFIRQKKSNDKR